MYKSEAPVGNGLSARIHQLNGSSSGAGLSSKRRSQSFLSRSPAATTLATSGIFSGSGGGSGTTHNNNQPFSYINGNNEQYHRHNPSTYYSLDRRSNATQPSATTTSKTAPIIYSQVLPKDQRPKKTTANHHQSPSTMTTTVGDDRHIHHYVYESPNKENRTKLKTQSHLHHDLRSTRPTTTQYRSNGNVTKVFINGDGGGGPNNYSGTEEPDDDILTPFSKRFSSVPRTTTNTNATNGYHGHGYNGHDLNSSGNTTTTSTSYYNTNGSSNNRYNSDYMSRGNNFDSSLASSSREASPSPPYYSQNHSSQRYETRASNLVRDAERQREREYTVPSAKLVRTYMFQQNGNGNALAVPVDDEDYEISERAAINSSRQHKTVDQDEDETDFVVRSRARRNNLSNRVDGNRYNNYKYSYMDDNDNDVDAGLNYDKRTTLRTSNGIAQSGTKYGENLISAQATHRRLTTQNSPQLSNQNRGVLKTSTIRKLTTPASNGNGYHAKSESLLVPERRQTSTLKTNTQSQSKSPPSSGNNFLSTLMRSKKSKSTMNVAKENGNLNSTQMRSDTGKPPSGTKHRGNILAILLRKATSSKDTKDKTRGKVDANGTQTLKKASSIPKIITDSEIEEVERRRDSGAYYSWSTSDLYGNQKTTRTDVSHSLENVNTDGDAHDHDSKTNRQDIQFSVRFATIKPPDEDPPSSDYYWNRKENGNYQYDDMSDYRRELATTSKPIQSMTNTNSLKKSVTLGRPPNKGPGVTNNKNDFGSSSYYPTSAMSLDRRLLNKKTPKIVVTDDSGEPYPTNSNKVKPAGRSMSFFSLRPKTQNQSTNTAETIKKWNFGFMNKSKPGNVSSRGSRNGEASFRYFGDTDVEDVPNRNRNVLRSANPEVRNRRITYSEDDDASRISKSNGNGMYLHASNNGSSSNASPYFAKRDGTVRNSQSQPRHYTTLLPGTSSATESEAELQTGLSPKLSNGATVFLHAATIAEIPPASPLPLHERSMSRDELSTIHSGTGSQTETHKLSRSVSVLAPWRPKHREGSEINYNSSDGMRSDFSKKPPRPYSLANRSTSSTSISPTDYGKGRSSGYGDWKKPRNGSVNSNDSLRLPKHHSHRTSSPSLLLPPPPSGPKRVRQPAPQSQLASGRNQKSVTLTRSQSMVDSTGDRNPRNKSGWSPFRRSRP